MYAKKNYSVPLDRPLLTNLGWNKQSALEEGHETLRLMELSNPKSTQLVRVSLKRSRCSNNVTEEVQKVFS